MGRDTDRTLCRLGSVRMLMRGKCDCRPEGQQHAQTRYPFRYRSHDGYPMKAFFESIPKRQTNATRWYLARYVLSTFETLVLHWPPVLVVVIGKTRVKAQHDDDHCPQNDQKQPNDSLRTARFLVPILTLPES